MPKLVLTRCVTDAERIALLVPRDDIVTEVAEADPTGDAAGRPTGVETTAGSSVVSFGASAGPFRSYRRTVELGQRTGDCTPATVTTEFRLAVPVWAFLFNPFVKRVLRKPPSPGQKAPWWSPPDQFDQRAATVLSVLAVFALFAGYLGTLLTQTNAFFGAEFGSSDAQIGVTLAITRVGAILALVVVALADRRGRRRILLAATMAACVLTATGALAPSLVWIGASQTLARAFSTAMALIISIIAVEEMPSGSRAFAVSVLTATGALGAGICVMLLWIAGLGTWTWRILYLVPLLGLPVVIKLRDLLPETLRFEVGERERRRALEHERRRATERELAPATRPTRIPKGRLLLLGFSGLLFSLFVAPASSFLNKYLIDDHGFSAGTIIAFQILTNTPGGIGLVVGGRLADRHGRRLVGSVGLGAGVGFTVAMYLGGGWAIWVFSLLGAVIGAAAVPALAVYGPELFPTANRARANGVINIFSVVGSSIGLAIAGLLSDHLGGLGPAMAVLAIGPVLVVVLILALYPETTSRELEDLNPEDAPLARELLALDGLDLDTMPERYPPNFEVSDSDVSDSGASGRDGDSRWDR